MQIGCRQWIGGSASIPADSFHPHRGPDEAHGAEAPHGPGRRANVPRATGGCGETCRTMGS